MFVKISAPQGAIKKESLTGMRGDVIKIDDRDLFVNIAASHTIQVTGQAITFDLVKILFQTKEDTAAAAETLRAAMSQGSTYVEISAGIASVVLSSKIS